MTTQRLSASSISLMSIVRWLVAALTLLSCVPSLAADAVDARAEILPTVHYLEDPQGTLDLASLNTAAYAERWQTSPKATANLGYTQSYYWFRVDLFNPGEVTLHKLFVIAAPYLDYVDYYLVRDGQVDEHFITGDQFPFDQRLVAHPQFLFPLQLVPGQNYSLYFHIRTPGAMEFPASLWNEREFHLHDSAKNQIDSVYYGILLFVIFFNVFIYLSLRERTYLYYVLFTLSILLIQSTLHAFTFEYLWPNQPWLQNMLILYCVPTAVIFSTLFARNFLDLDRESRVLSLIFRGLTGLGVIALIIALFVPYQFSTRISIVLVVPTCLALLVAGPILWWRGNAVARYYTIAWAVLQLGASSTILFKLGILPASFITQYGLQCGSAMEAVLLSVAIADRVYRERNDKLSAQQRIMEQTAERYEVERKLLEQATHNSVSGLPNRVLFENKVQDQIQNRYEQQFLIVLIHFSRFHEIDKTLGHDNADRLLRQISQVLNLFCSQLDGVMALETAGNGRRYFLASNENVTLGLLLHYQGPLDQDERIHGLQEEARKRIEFDHLTLDLGARVGVAHYPFHSLTTNGLIRKARIALDAAAADPNQVAIYRKELDPYNERRLTLMAELDKAIANDSLELHFQPQMEVQSGRIKAVETLARWKHPEYGYIPPDEFVVLAERTGIITPLTRWVLENTIKALAELRNAGKDLHFSINISAINLREADFARHVAALLQQYDVAPQDITLEITETAMMSNPIRALQELLQLHQIGVRLAIDDFGTGYSSLSYIRKLPIDEIKIDKSLIFDLSTRQDDQVIVKTTLDMCHNLGYKVVAEGVETEEALGILRDLGCDLIQGYHLAKPMPLNHLFDWLESYADRRGTRAGSASVDIAPGR